MSPNSSCHPWKIEALREEMTSLRSQSKLGDQNPKQIPVLSVPSHFTSCLSSPSGPPSESSSHHSHCLQLVFIESPLGQAWGRTEAPTSTMAPLRPQPELESNQHQGEHQSSSGGLPHPQSGLMELSGSWGEVRKTSD